MKTHTVTTYSLNELSAESQDVAFRNYQNNAASWEIPWAEEMLASIKAIASACGLRLTDWNLGDSSNRSQNISVEGNCDDLQGLRALCWFARILKSHGYEISPQFKNQKFPGTCGFTGYCFDDDCAEAVWKELLDGETVADAFSALAGVYARNADAELDHQQSREAFEEWSDGVEFLESGEVYQ